MYKSIAVSLAAIALIGTSALAADLPPTPMYKAPAATPIYSWTGCYIGANAGYGWQRNSPSDPLTPGLSVGSDTGTGFVGGGQFGCDYQLSDRWVVGLQGMFDGAAVNGSHMVPVAYAGDAAEQMTFKSNWLATVTGRIGYAVLPQTLLYLKGGAAWVHTNYTDVDPSGVTYVPFAGQASATLNGWTAGVGAEYAFRPNWSVLLEYDYIGLGTHSAAFTYNCGTGCGFGNPYLYRETHNFQMVLVGLNYRFGGVGGRW